MSLPHSIREISQGTQYQGENETIVYTITTTNWAASPTTPSMVVKNNSTGADVTSTIAPSGSITASGDVITLKPLTAMTAGTTYRVEVQFTVGSNTFEVYFFVLCEV